MADHTWDFIGHEQILVGQCLMTDCYLQPGCTNSEIQNPTKNCVFRCRQSKILRQPQTMKNRTNKMNLPITIHRPITTDRRDPLT